MEDRVMIEITEVTDDSTGCWQVGDIDVVIYGEVVRKYLQLYGNEGKRKLIEALAEIMYWVQKEVESLSKKIELLGC